MVKTFVLRKKLKRQKWIVFPIIHFIILESPIDFILFDNNSGFSKSLLQLKKN